jgi:hypothetical protein
MAHTVSDRKRIQRDAESNAEEIAHQTTTVREHLEFAGQVVDIWNSRLAGGRANCSSRPLSKPIDIGGRRKLRTLHDVRSYLLKIPKERQTNIAWQNITRLVMDAAQSGETIDLTVPFALARPRLNAGVHQNFVMLCPSRASP